MLESVLIPLTDVVFYVLAGHPAADCIESTSPWLLSHYPYTSNLMALKPAGISARDPYWFQGWLSHSRLSSAELPFHSAEPSIVQDYLAGELDEATIRVAGLDKAVHVNPNGLSPTRQPSKFRLITELFSPDRAVSAMTLNWCCVRSPTPQWIRL
uniref:Uncharacterized protein n=1 Tax=Amphimedon queenslandica TaxID=400682 RepID=A0A1X7URP1_AMPQE